MDSRITTAARLQQQKNYPAAEQIYRQVLRNQPNQPDALLLLGLLLHETSRNELAIDPLRRAIALRPNHADVRKTLVGVLQALGKLSEAIADAGEVVKLNPQDAEAWFAVSQLMLQTGNYAGAVQHARRAAELRPGAAAIFVTLSRAQLGLEDIAGAMASIDRALALDANNVDAFTDKGNLLQLQGQIDQAIPWFETALTKSPQNIAALNNLGTCYLMKGLAAQALKCFEAAAAVWPNSPKPRNNIGAALKDLGQIDQAIVHFEKAIEIDPNYADGYCNLGGAYATIAEHEKAIAAARQTLRIKPDFAGVGSNLLLAMLSPTGVSAKEIFTEHLDWDRRHAADLRSDLPPLDLNITENARIRIGYVSADFREHSVRYFIEPVLANHDRSRFEIFCYAAGKRRDEVTDRFSKLADSWHEVAGLNDRQLAELIRSHRVDILVDLAGHTSDHRLLAFARRPAPVQVAYLGYPATTGLAAMDYRLTDTLCDPIGADEFYTEKLVRLRQAFFVYNDDPAKPFDPQLPADRNGFFTFGSFNAFTKINDQTLQTWATILQSVPRSRLIFKAKPMDNPSTRQKVLKVFADHGIAENRLDLRSWVTLAEHIALLGSGIDLMLDTFPYNGHTTTCQSLWMGVPVVTQIGESFRSRVGHTILNHLDLSEFIARDWEEYQQIAIASATDWTRLRTLRPQLRERMIQSPLCDAVAFTKEIEAAYLVMASKLPSNA